MRIDIQPKPRTTNSPGAIDRRSRTNEPIPVAPLQTSPPTPAPAREATIRVDRLQIEGCGPVSPHALREGFRSVWVANRPALEKLAAQPDAFADRLRAPLDLRFTTTPDGFRLGQAIARSILRSTLSR